MTSKTGNFRLMLARLVFAFAFAFGLAGALGLAHAEARQIRIRSAERTISVPSFRQKTGYTCGPASARSVFAYYGHGELGERQLARRMGTTSKDGTDPGGITRVARALGFKTAIKHHMTMGELEGYVKRGVPVIVAYQAWADHPAQVDYRRDWDDGHYSVVVGMDARNVYFADPSTRVGWRGFIPRREFEARWHDTDRAQRKLDQLGIVLESPTPPVDKVLIRHASKID